MPHRLAWANDFRAVFRVAIIPGVLAASLLLVGMVADTAPEDPRGTACGFFNLLSGLAQLA